MKKILSIIILIALVSVNNVQSQTIQLSNLSYLPNDSVRLNIFYGIGCSNPCPTLNSLQKQTVGDTIYVSLFYNSIPCNPGACASLDTTYLGTILPNTLKAVKLKSLHVILVALPNIYDTSYNMSDSLILTFPWSGIDDFNTHYFSISPNPAQVECTIEYTLPGEAILTDITGRRLNCYVLPVGKNKETIDISHLARGVYLLEHKTKEINKTIRFLKE